jgi:hypothetical protein
LVQKLAKLAISLMQDILGDPKVQLIPFGDATDAPMPLQIKPEVDLAPYTCSNAAMKLAVICALWMHAHAVLPARALAGSLSESLLTWLMEEAELVVETDTPHDACTQWAILCAEVLMRTGVATDYASPATQLCVFWGTFGSS